jgi:hypothetical protein
VWLNRAGIQADVTWQLPQALSLGMWLPGLPVARLPSWQLAQVSVIPEWSNFAGFHAAVEWQSPHSARVTMWLALCPAAVVPL